MKTEAEYKQTGKPDEKILILNKKSFSTRRLETMQLKEQKMNKVVKLIGVFIVLSLIFTEQVFAGVPFTNLEGVGGAAFNPFAYPANSGSSLGDPNSELGKLLGRPQIGAWYVNLGESKIDWTSIGISETFFKRLEVSFGHETISPDGADNITKDSVGAKLLLIEENSWDTKWVPAVSVGIIGKHTSPVKIVPTADSSGYDYYLVATKLITSPLPRPLLLSGGVLSTDGYTTGVLGYSNDRDTTYFANADLVILDNVAVGAEYKQGAEFNDGFNNADYWDAHVAWFVNKNLSLIGAYVNAGDENSSSKVGFGEGLVLSMQYAF
jgi:hypothetical protein